MPFVKTNSSCSLPYTAQLMMSCYLKVWESSSQILSLWEKTAGGCRNNENKCTLRTGWVTPVQKSTVWCAPNGIAGNCKVKAEPGHPNSFLLFITCCAQVLSGQTASVTLFLPCAGWHSFKMLPLLGERGCGIALAGGADWRGKEKQQWCSCSGGSLQSIDKWHQQLEQSWSAAQMDGDGCSGYSCKP